MSGITSSVAGRSFSEAEDTLHQLPMPYPRLAPPLDLQVSTREQRTVGDLGVDTGSTNSFVDPAPIGATVTGAYESSDLVGGPP